MKKIYLLSILCSLYFTTEATIRNVPSVYTTIQTALDSCAAGDTVLVQPGTYFENIVWPDIANIKLFSAGDSSNTIINGGALNTVIYFHDMFMSATIDSNTVIKGFKITGGGYNILFAYGCGIWMLRCSPKLEEISVTGNHTYDFWGGGAGIYAESSDMILSNSTVEYNQIDTSTWADGAGIFWGGGNPVLNNVNINDNLAICDGVGCKGGGIYFIECSSIILNNVSVYNNTMTGGSSRTGGGMYFKNDTIVQLNNVSVYNNNLMNDGEGAGLYIDNCPAVTLTDLIVNNNVITNGGSGAGIYLNGLSNLTLNNVLISSNVTGTGGTGIGLDVNSSGCLVNIFNSTITDNVLLDSSSINESGVFISGIVNCINSILWNENLSSEIQNFGTANFSYSDIRGGYTGTGNIDTLPGFVSATDFHLTPGSPCLNIGTLPGAPPFDLDNMPRPAPAGTNPDMGCYELNQPVGVNEMDGKNNLFEISPNPANELLIISYPLTENQKTLLTITDAKGKIILSKQLPQHTSNYKLQTSNFSQGIYFVEVDNGKEKAVKKFLKE